MTLTARLVIRDCEVALSELRSITAEQGPLWRPRWAAAVALLRTVMHVLDKVDAPSDPALKRVAKESWDQLKASAPEPVIFWSFIEEERNLLLKEYRTAAQQSVVVHVVGVGITVNGGAANSAAEPPQKPWAEYDYRMGEGSFEGRDPRDVVEEAVSWLRGYLDELDRQAGSLRHGAS